MSPENFMPFNNIVSCDHNWYQKETTTPNGGMMRIKICINCGETEGYGFVSREHEIEYLESLYNNNTPDDLEI